LRLPDLRQWTIALTGSAIVAVASAGASSASTPTSTTRVVEARYGFSLSLPAGWQQVQLTKAGVNKMVQRLEKLDPKMSALVGSQSEQATIRRLQLYAIGPPQGSTLPNINVLVQSPQDLPSGASFLSQAEPLMKSELQSAGFKQVTTSIVHLPLGSAVEGQYSVPGVSDAITQLYISHRSRLYIVTFSSASVAAQIENTWHWQ
jgi:hypothetical protein